MIFSCKSVQCTCHLTSTCILVLGIPYDFSNKMESSIYIYIYIYLWWDLGSFTCAMTQLLSHYKAIRSTILGTTPSLVLNFLIQTILFATSYA